MRKLIGIILILTVFAFGQVSDMTFLSHDPGYIVKSFNINDTLFVDSTEFVTRTADNQFEVHDTLNNATIDTLTVDTLSSRQINNTTQQTITLGTGATTFAVTSNVIQVTGDGGGNTIGTITGAGIGIYTFIFVDTNVTITDTDGHAANTVDLSAAFTSADDTVLQLSYDGTSWYEVSRSTN